MLRDLLNLIEIYKSEANEYYEEYAHGDSTARQKAYERVINDLKQIIIDNE